MLIKNINKILTKRYNLSKMSFISKEFEKQKKETKNIKGTKRDWMKKTSSLTTI